MYLVEPGHLRDASNLRIISNRTVVRVLFEGKKAVGLEICAAPAGPLGDTVHPKQCDRVRAKMVILAGGAFGSPMILERSGIGQQKVLEAHGIEVKVDLPGVGAEYQDHEVHMPKHGGADADLLSSRSAATS